ncbi:NADPH:quinone oxidoreductase-like isoform X1 [Tripterygium wilfordii]|uniref:NAD(P)H dehydrogenase (quinone) n=1 Tax=Tripterygium wilfordii TaxID=458696 RepID=A0A7J7CHY2_TRIWF|nr:NADPH:quinone oxidoreductase-like [Tripterygium wilfordii]KAF5733639.1 NADPH:quinone oxidoreductase-like isoform X1 [Tripterygium wilfordii]
MGSLATENQTIKVAAINGSLRESSFNGGLIRSAIEIAKESIPGMEIEYVDISTLPLMNIDLGVREQAPPAVKAFGETILKADCILFASPEYNYSVSAPLKNALDWVSIPPVNVWAGKPAAIVSASGGSGGARAQYHLRQIGVYLDLHFINKPEFFLNAFQPPQKFDGNGDLIDAEAKERLKDVLVALREFTLRLEK